jgi:hypothetical protein
MIGGKLGDDGHPAVNSCTSPIVGSDQVTLGLTEAIGFEQGVNRTGPLGRDDLVEDGQGSSLSFLKVGVALLSGGLPASAAMQMSTVLSSACSIPPITAL